MSALPLASGSLSTAPTANGPPSPVLWTGPNYTCSISIRLMSTSSNPVDFVYYVNGQVRSINAILQPQQTLDVDVGLKVPPGATFSGYTNVANGADWCISGIQNDGQP